MKKGVTEGGRGGRGRGGDDRGIGKAFLKDC